MFFRTLFVFLFIFGATLDSLAFDKMMSIKFGPYWPVELQNSKKATAFDLSIQSGRNIDKKVAFGAAFDFIWNKNSEETHISGHQYKEELIERTLMFPLSAYLSISPLSDLPVSPSVSGQIGIGFMHFSEKDTVTKITGTELFSENGWYFGPVYKIALDAIVNLGLQAALFFGTDYQWSKPKKIKRSDPHLFTMRDMSGWGLRVGVSAFF